MQDVVARLNGIATTLYFDDQFGPPKFESVEESGKEWSVAFRSRRQRGTVSFTLDWSATTGDGSLDDLWLTALKDAIFDWESADVSRCHLSSPPDGRTR